MSQLAEELERAQNVLEWIKTQENPNAVLASHVMLVRIVDCCKKAGKA